MTVRRKLVLMCAGVAGIQLASATCQTWFSRRAAEHQARSREAHEQLEQLAQIEAGVVWKLKELGDMAAEESEVGAEQERGEAAVAQERVDRALERFTALFRKEQDSHGDGSSNKETEDARQLSLHLHAQRTAAADVEALVQGGNVDRDDLASLETRSRKALAVLNRVSADEREDMLDQDRTASRWASRATTTAWAAPLMSALILLSALVIVLRSISGPLSDLAVGATRVAAGDLEVPVPVRSRDEIGGLAAAFNDMQLSLKNRIAERDLALQDARFRILSEAAPVAIAEIDRAGCPVYRNQRWNELTCGQSSPDRPWSEMVHADDRARAISLEAAGAAEELRLECGVETVWVVARVAPLAGADGDRAILALADVTAQKVAIARAEEMGRELMTVSRKAGMAEISAGVLHNVGNVLSSVVVSASALKEQLRASRVGNLIKAARMLEEHSADVAGFLATDRGKLVPAYLVQATSQLASDLGTAEADLSRIEKGIDHIRAIISTQQGYARTEARSEKLRISEVTDDVLTMNSTSLGRHAVRIVKRFVADPEIISDRHKIMQVLVNLINNARQALEGDGSSADRTIAISTRLTAEGTIALEVADNGAGIAPENVARIFEHGFTTRKTGHGFGLHSSALAAVAMGGRLRVKSDGVGRGASFTLELPLVHERAA